VARLSQLVLTWILHQLRVPLGDWRNISLFGSQCLHRIEARCRPRGNYTCERGCEQTVIPSLERGEVRHVRSSRALRINSRNSPCREDAPAILLILTRLYSQWDFVAPLLVKLGFCRIRFWYPVALGSGISRENRRIFFWNLTGVVCVCGKQLLLSPIRLPGCPLRRQWPEFDWRSFVVTRVVRLPAVSTCGTASSTHKERSSALPREMPLE
jgi:hypothetical protein